MRKFLNTLYVLNKDAYLSLEGENIVLLCNKAEIGRVPLHTLEGIVCFSYPGASPALMGKCTSLGVDLSFFSPQGRFLARAVGEERGSVLLRQTQYRIADSEAESWLYARNFILGKVYNARWVLERATRDHPQRVPVEQLKRTSAQLAAALPLIEQCDDLDQLRGLEGEAAQRYFDCFDSLILQHDDFAFTGRSRRPPLDNTNALLSFAYSLLASDCTAALQSVGLDPYVGFLHRARPGRRSLSCINQKIMTPKHFQKQENGAVLLTDEGRRAFLGGWQTRKQETITHPFLNEKLPWGLVPYVQALLLARTLRGDMDLYPPFFWKRGMCMLVLITYDVNTETPAGRKRLRKVAKPCVDHGQRVQNSVFECLLDAAQYAVLKAELTSLIDPALDSLRFYQLGNNYKSKVEHIGVHPPFEQDGLLLF